MGDLIETPASGLALTVRGNGVPAMTFSEGTAKDLRRLTGKAAEYVYSKSQPARWAKYLTNVDRFQDAIAFCRAELPTSRVRLHDPGRGDVATAVAEMDVYGAA